MQNDTTNTSPLYNPNDQGIEQLKTAPENGEKSEAELRAEAFESSLSDTEFAGEQKDINDERNTGYADTQLDGHNIDDPRFANTEDEPGDHSIVKSEAEIDDKVIGDEEMDQTRLSIEDVAESQVREFGLATAAAAFMTLEPLAADIVRTGALRENQENPSQEEICTQGNNLCKAATIYAISAKEKSELAIQKLPFDIIGAQIFLQDIALLEQDAQKAASSAIEQTGQINDYRLADHIKNRAAQAIDLAASAKAALEAAISKSAESEQQLQEFREKAKDANAEDVAEKIFTQAQQEAEQNPDSANDPETVTQGIEQELDKFLALPTMNPETGIPNYPSTFDGIIPDDEYNNGGYDKIPAGMLENLTTPQKQSGSSMEAALKNAIETPGYDPTAQQIEQNEGGEA